MVSGDVQFAQTGDSDDVARFRNVALDTPPRPVSQYFTDFTVTGFAFAIDDSNLLVGFTLPRLIRPMPITPT